MKLEQLIEGAAPVNVKKIVDTALKAIRSDAKVKVTTKSGMDNLVTVHFPVESPPSHSAHPKGSIFLKDQEDDRKAMKQVAKKLLAEIQKKISLEDHNIDTTPRAITLFMVSDDFMK